MKFKDKIAAITGGGSGIGKETAIQFARQGAQVAILDINKDSVQQVAKELKALGTDPLALQCDVSQSHQVADCFRKIKDKYSRLDILFSNAGIYRGGAIESLTDGIWHEQLGVNLNGTFFCNREALKIMIPQGSGAIINMSSIWGGMSDAGSSASFSASKAGIVGFTRAEAIQAARHGININAIAPGYVDTPIGTPEAKARVYPEIIKKTPLGRIGKVEDIAPLVLFLASDEASFIVGQVISPNGGLVV
jgi:3-oxoacyl-[acyl-carrier protein] reductase